MSEEISTFQYILVLAVNSKKTYNIKPRIPMNTYEYHNPVSYRKYRICIRCIRCIRNI